jgi:hypothetical protein
MNVPIGDGALAVKISAMVVRLPDFDDRATDRSAGGIENTAAEPGDRAHCRGDGVVEDQQVVIPIERQVVRVVGAFCLRRGLDQRVGERAANREERAGQSYCAEKAAPVWPPSCIEKRLLHAFINACGQRGVTD